MTVNDLLKSDIFSTVAVPDADREITGCYIGDLLSWVMGRAQADSAWITIMSNINIVAVASLTDVSCIVLAEGVSVDDNVKNTALAKGINIISTDITAYDAAVSISKMI